MTLYKMIELPSDEPVQFVGVYVLRWGNGGEPTVGFREATPEEIAEQSPTSENATQGCPKCKGGFLHKKGCSQELAFFDEKPEHEEPCAHVGEECPECEGTGEIPYNFHACNGDERLCQRTCPVQGRIPCPTCGGE